MTTWVIYARTESGAIERMYVADGAAIDVAEYTYRESLTGWPETEVRWARETGPSAGVAEAAD